MLRHIRGKYACVCCQTIAAAPMTAQIIDKGIPAPGLPVLQGGSVARGCGIDGTSPLARARLHGRASGSGTAVTQRLANHTVAVRLGWRWAWGCPSSRCGKLQTGQSASMPSPAVWTSVNGATLAATNVFCPVII